MKRAKEFLNGIYGKGSLVQAKNDLPEAFLYALDNMPKSFKEYYESTKYKDFTKRYYYGGYEIGTIGKSYGMSDEDVKRIIARTMSELRTHFGDLFKVGYNAYIVGKRVKDRKLSNSVHIPLEDAIGKGDGVAFNILRKAGYADLAAVYNDYLDGKLENIRGMGKSHMQDVKELLVKNGYAIEIEGKRMARAELFLQKLYGTEHAQVKEDITKTFFWVLNNLRGVSNVNPKYKQAMILYFYTGLTYDEVGEKLGVTRERVRQMNVKTLRIIRGNHGVAFKIGLDNYLKELKEKEEYVKSDNYIPLEELGMLSVRTYNVLKRAGINDLESLYAEYEKDRLMSTIRNMSARGLEEVKSVLKQYGKEV